MTGRTLRHVVVAGCYQGLAGEAHGCAQSGSGTGARRSPLISPLLNIERFRVLAIILLVLSFAAPITSAESVDSCLGQVLSPTPVTGVHIQPDSGIQPVLDEINAAQCSIDLSMYFFTAQGIVDSLERAVDRGIRVRVILERQPFGTFGDQREMFDRLGAIGVDVAWGPDRFMFSHAKYMIVDESVLLVTNQNFTGAGFNSNREFGVITTEQKYVEEATAIFQADWSGASFDGSVEHLVVSPINSRSTIPDLIDRSSNSIWMYSEVLRDEEITTALGNAADRGVDVRVLVNESTDAEDVPYFLDALGHGVQIRVLPNPYVHSKVMIVDGNAALVGSQNYSYTSLNLNREMGIVLTDEGNLEKIITVYIQDWARGEPVDTISHSGRAEHFALTPAVVVGRIPCVRWRVV